LQLTYDGPNILGVESGEAYVPGLGKVVEVPTRLTVNSLNFPTTSTAWHYVYLTETSGAATIRVTTTPPVIYRGYAKQQSGDANARYLGAVLPNGATTPTMHKWHWRAGNRVFWLEDVQLPPFRIFNGGPGNTIENTYSCAPVIPPSARVGLMTFRNLSNTYGAWFGNPDDTFTLWPPALLHIPAGENIPVHADYPLGGDRQYTFRTSGSDSGGHFSAVRGYIEER
jgi:hypothetical protein